MVAHIAMLGYNWALSLSSPPLKFTPDLIAVACGASNASADCFLGHDQSSSLSYRQCAKITTPRLLALTVSLLGEFARAC